MEKAKPPIRTFDEAIASAVEFIGSEETRSRIQDGVSKGLLVAYRIEFRHHPSRGLAMEITFEKGSRGQVRYFGNLQGGPERQGGGQ